MKSAMRTVRAGEAVVRTGVMKIRIRKAASAGTIAARTVRRRGISRGKINIEAAERVNRKIPVRRAVSIEAVEKVSRRAFIRRTASIEAVERVSQRDSIRRAVSIGAVVKVSRGRLIRRTASIGAAVRVSRRAFIRRAVRTGTAVRISSIGKVRADRITVSVSIAVRGRIIGGRMASVRRAISAVITVRASTGKARTDRIIASVSITARDRTITDRTASVRRVISAVITSQGTVMIPDPDRKEGRGRMTVSLKENERIDDLQRNGYRIIQNPKKFCFGMDAVLLTGFAHARETDTLLDLGTGTGIIPLLMEAKYGCSHLTGLEIQPESADMAARSVALNDLAGKIEIVTGDIKEAGSMFPPASFDCITCNPPYMIGKHGIVNPQDSKAIARHEILCTLEDVVRQTAGLLKPGGHFFLVHRPFRLAEIMTLLVQYRLEPKRMQLVYPYVDKEPNMVLLEAVRGGKSRMTVEKPLIVFRAPGEYMPEIREVYGY